MATPKELKDKAFVLFCSGIPPMRIAEIIGVNPPVVYQWDKRGKWKDKRNEINKYKDEMLNMSNMEQDLKVVETILALYGKAIKESQHDMIKKLRYRDVLDALKFRRLVKGESTENINVANPFTELKKILEEKEDE